MNGMTGSVAACHRPKRDEPHPGSGSANTQAQVVSLAWFQHTIWQCFSTAGGHHHRADQPGHLNLMAHLTFKQQHNDPTVPENQRNHWKERLQAQESICGEPVDRGLLLSFSCASFSALLSPEFRQCKSVSIDCILAKFSRVSDNNLPLPGTQASLSTFFSSEKEFPLHTSQRRLMLLCVDL